MQDKKTKVKTGYRLTVKYRKEKVTLLAVKGRITAVDTIKAKTAWLINP